MRPAHGPARSAPLLGTERRSCAARCAMLCEARARGNHQSATAEQRHPLNTIHAHRLRTRRRAEGFWQSLCLEGYGSVTENRPMKGPHLRHSLWCTVFCLHQPQHRLMGQQEACISAVGWRHLHPSWRALIGLSKALQLPLCAFHVS